MYREEKYSNEECHLVEQAIKYRVKNNQAYFWEPMFYYYSNNQFNLSFLYAHKFYNNSVKEHNTFFISSACNWLGDHWTRNIPTLCILFNGQRRKD